MTSISFVTKPEKTIVIVNHLDTFMSGENLEVRVLRSNKPLQVTILKDSLRKEISVLSKIDNLFWLNSLSYFFVGALVDLTNKKRYTYPKKVYVNLQKDDVESKLGYRLWLPDDKPMKFTLNLPVISFLDYKTANPIYPGSTIPHLLGLGGGFDTKISKNYFVTVSGSYKATSIFKLFAQGNAGEFDKNNPEVVWYFMDATACVNRRLGDRFSVGAGLTDQFFHSEVNWDSIVNYGATNYPTCIKTETFGLGLRLQAQYQVSRRGYYNLYWQPIISHSENSSGKYMDCFGLEYVLKF